MSRKNCFVKISGDMLRDEVLEWIRELNREYFVVMCVGGGTQINDAFAKVGLPVGKFGPLGRETQTFRERQLARDVLEENQTEIQDRLAVLGVHVSVVIPVLDIGTVLCHVNGDQFTLAAYLGFDVLYVVTTFDRIEEKRETYAPYPKVKVVGLTDIVASVRRVSRELVCPRCGGEMTTFSELDSRWSRKSGERCTKCHYENRAQWLETGIGSR